MAHYWRRGEWRGKVEEWSVEQLKEMEVGRRKRCTYKSKVEEWLREGGEMGE